MKNSDNRILKFLSLSPALIWQSFKLNWYLPLLIFMAYFVSGIMPIMILPKGSEGLGVYAQECINMSYSPFWIIMMLAPLVAAVLSMSYYHTPEKALALHSQPFSKSKLYNSHILSGWLMVMIPALAIALIYVGVMGMVPPLESGDPACSLLNVGSWLYNTGAIMTFYYGIYVLAGSLVGNIVMHLLLSGVFFGICPLVAFLIDLYCKEFIVGYVMPMEWIKFLMNDTNPVSQVVMSSLEHMNFHYFLMAGIVMLLMAHFICRMAKLEKVGDSLLFRFTEEILTILLVFVGMSFFGFFVRSFVSTLPSFIIGILIGMLITFLVVKIIISRSVKIFTKQNLASVLTCIVAAGIFCAFTVFDLTGIGKKIPSEDEIDAISGQNLSAAFENSLSSSKHLDEKQAGAPNIKDKAFIAKALELQQYILDNKLYEIPDSADNQVLMGWGLNSFPDTVVTDRISFSYTLKNGKIFKRAYTIILDDKIVEKIDALLSNIAYKDIVKVSDSFEQSIISISLSGPDVITGEGSNYNEDQGAYDTLVISDRDHIREIVEAYNKHLSSYSYRDVYKSKSDRGTYNYTMDFRFENIDQYMWIDFYRDDTYMSECLKKLGYEIRH